MRRLRWNALLRVALILLWTAILLLHVSQTYTLDSLQRLETWTYDTRLRLLPDPLTDPRVVIIDIDEASLTALGRWPWPRDRLADLTRLLLDHHGASLVAFDVVFAEPDVSSGLPVLEALADGPLQAETGFVEALEGLRPLLDYDALFAQALRGRPVLLGYYLNSGEDSQRIGQLPAPVFDSQDFGGYRPSLARASGYGANLRELQDAALGAGHMNPLFDVDGLSRRVPMLIDLDGAYYESLSLAVARWYLGGLWPRAVVGVSAAQQYLEIEWLRLGDRSIPLDARGAALIPYVGPQGSFPYISAATVLHGDVPEGYLRGKIAMVGTSAPGLMDLRATPLDPAFPGVEIHANLVQGILEGRIRHQPAYFLAVEALAVLIIGILMALTLPWIRPAAALGVFGVLLLGVLLVAGYLWQFALLVLPLAALLALVIGAYVMDSIYGFFVESRMRARVAALFGQYVPPRIVETLTANPKWASMAGESREMSVLFSDVRNFTNISEGLPAQDLAALMNDYLSTMTRALYANDGTVDKYIGDAIMAFWGAPLPQERHAELAVHGAWAMQEAAADLRASYPQRGWPPLQIGIGINSGLMNVGNMGSEFRRAYTVLGDAVNLAARLEGLTKKYGLEILVSDSTRQATESVFFYREIDRIQVKGKQEAVVIHQPLQPRKDPDAVLSESWQDRVAAYRRMLAAYRAMDWTQAEHELHTLQTLGESPVLVQLFRERVAYFWHNPPHTEWNGVFQFADK